MNWGSALLSLGLGILGALITHSPIGFMVGFSIGSAVGSLLFKTPGLRRTEEGPRLSDLRVQTSTYGQPIPVVYGAMRVAGNVIWADSAGIKETRHEEVLGDVTRVTYTYSATFAVGLCQNSIIGILRIWAEDRLIWDAGNPIPGSTIDLNTQLGGVLSLFAVNESSPVLNQPSINFTLYKGSETQTADPLIEADVGTGNAPGFRGLAYVVIRDMPLTPFGNRLPNLSFEVVSTGTYTRTCPVVSGGQANSSNPVIDPLSGLVWQPDYGEGKVRVVRPDTWAVVKTITGFPVNRLRQACYQPPFYMPHKNGLISDGNNEITLKRYPPRMWFGDDYSIYLGATVSAINTESYAQTDFNILDTSTAFAGWPGNVVTDLREWQWQEPNQLAQLLLGVLSPQFLTLVKTVDTLVGGDLLVPPGVIAFGSNAYPLMVKLPINFDDGSPSLYEKISWGSAGIPALGYTMQAALSREFLYVVDGYGVVQQIGQLVDGAVPSSLTKDTGYLGSASANRIAYDDYDHAVYVLVHKPSADSHVLRLDPTTLAVVWDRTYTNSASTGVKPKDLDVQVGSRDLWVACYDPGTGGTQWDRLDKATGATVEAFTISSALRPNSGLTRMVMYPNAPFACVTDTYGLVKVPIYPAPVNSGVPLSTIVSDLSVRAGLTTGDITVTALTDLVSGYALSQRAPVRGFIEPLQQAYFFDAVESDYKMTFVKRGGASILTLPYTDCAAHNVGDTMPASDAMSRQPNLELPNHLDVTFIDPAAWYNSATQYARRLIGNVQDKVTVELPIAMTPTKAKQVADVLLHNAWSERTTHTITTTRKYFQLDPTDVITFTDRRGASNVLRINKIDYQHPNLMKLTCVDEDPSVYAFTRTGVGSLSSDTGIQPSTLPALYLMDIPLLRDADDGDYGFYVAGEAGAAWKYSDLNQSQDGGVTYSTIKNLTYGAPAGRALNALDAPTNWETWDDASELYVILSSGFIFDAPSDLDVLNGANLLLVGDELIQYRRADYKGGGVYRLWRLLRGRRGTDWACPTHAVGDRVVVLNQNEATVTRYTGMLSTEVGDDYRYKLVPMGIDANFVQPVSLTCTAAALKPYAPVQVAGSRDGSNNLTITWIRRTRTGGDWADGGDVDLGETSEAYEVDIYKNGAVVRTISVTAQTASYTAANQVTDFGSAQSTVTIKVYQISSTVDRGFAATATV
jgi:hypothetical protein